jgi:hypothetical protein
VLLAILTAVCAAVFLTADSAAEATLEITHKFAAFVGNRLNYKDFPIETVRASAGAWGAPAAGFAALWAAIVWIVRPRPDRARREVHPFWLPILLGWTGCALILALEKAAAPMDLVTPYPFDRVLFPATLAAALLLAVRCRTLLLTFSWLSLFVALSRIPLAIVGTFATRDEWGTSLDVHSIVHFGDPIRQQPVIVEAGSNVQLGWLIWVPNLIVFPAIYMCSAGGVALLRVMLVKAAAERASAGGSG